MPNPDDIHTFSASLPMYDWRISQGDSAPEDLPTEPLRSAWKQTVEARDGRILITATAPNGTKRYVMLEIDRGHLAVRAYLDENQMEQPLSILLGDDLMRIVPPTAVEGERVLIVSDYGLNQEACYPCDIPAAALAPADAA